MFGDRGPIAVVVIMIVIVITNMTKFSHVVETGAAAASEIDATTIEEIPYAEHEGETHAQHCVRAHEMSVRWSTR